VITDMVFENREDAAHLLAERLSAYHGKRPLVLAIPRGAVPMGRIVADALDGDLDVALVRKLRAPDNPELAIGSIDESGRVYLDPRLRDLWTRDYLDGEERLQLETLRKRRQMYSKARPPADPAGRIVIVLDDGIATGSTMIAALRAVRARQPARLIAATAVAPPETLRRLAREADEIVCLEAPAMLWAIGSFFRDFTQVTDEEAVAALQMKDAAPAEVAAAAAPSGHGTPSSTRRSPPR
jgi:predicted phosphoribosyltransferase